MSRRLDDDWPEQPRRGPVTKSGENMQEKLASSTPTNSPEERRLPPLQVIDVIDKWIHQQTRFHLTDTDNCQEMLAELADVITTERTKALVANTRTLTKDELVQRIRMAEYELQRRQLPSRDNAA